jgi:hypothetical protein
MKVASKRTRALHRKALRYNWDDGIEGLKKILDDRACDRGTALAIYWMGAPGYYREYRKVTDAESWERKTLRFLRALERRYLRGEFTPAALLFNPRFDKTTVASRGHDWTSEYSDVKVVRPIPAEMLEPSIPDPAWEKKRGRKKKSATRARRLK